MPADHMMLQVLQAQRRIFRLAERDHGMTLKGISIDSGIPYETLRSYSGSKENQAVMPITAVNRLAGVIPDPLLSQLFDPADRHLVINDDDEELDDLADRADEIAREVRRARHPNSPGGTEIVAIEEERIKRLQRTLTRGRAA